MTSLRVLLIITSLSVGSLQLSAAFQISTRLHHTIGPPSPTTKSRYFTLLTATSSNQKDVSDKSSVEEYRNVGTKLLSNFVAKGGSSTDPLAEIDFQAEKIPCTTSLDILAAALDYDLIQSEWFVTGKVNPCYFSDDFTFQDPDVKVNGIEDYARGVNKLFDQSTSRAEIISTVVNTTVVSKSVITVTWRLSGGVNLGGGCVYFKPYIVYTDFVVDPTTSLITFQEDRFDIPSWDIFLSILFPFMIGIFTSAPAPPVPPRQVDMPILKS